MNPSFAQATPQHLQPGDPGYDVLLEAASGPLDDALGGRVVLEVERMDRVGNWAFVLGNMRAPAGGRPDFGGTRFADPAGQGAMSDVYVALLRREPGAQPGDAAASAAPAEAAARDQAGETPGADAGGGSWTVLEHAIGPGDVAWLEWPTEHAAPRALFGF